MAGEFAGYDPTRLLSSWERGEEELKAASQESQLHQVTNPGAPDEPQNPLEALTRQRVAMGIMQSNVAYKQRHELTEIALAENLGKSPLGTVPPNEGYHFEGVSGDAAEHKRQAFLRDDTDATFLQPEQGLDPSKDSHDSWYAPRNVTNFLLSDEMGLLGIKWTEDSASWSWQNFKAQLSEHPYRSALTLASWLIPIGAAWMKGARVARRAAELAKTSEFAPIEKVIPSIPATIVRGEPIREAGVKVHGLWGEATGADLLENSTLETMKRVGPRVRFDEHAALVRQLAFSPDIADGRRLFTPERLQKLKTATDKEIAQIVPEKELRRILLGDMHTARYLKLAGLAKVGELGGRTDLRRAELWLWQTFGNKYFEGVTGLTSEHVKGIDKWIKDSGIGKWLASAPDITDIDAQKNMYRWFGGKQTDQQLIDAVGADAAGWAKGLKKDWMDLMDAQVAEGFIDKETADMFTQEFGGFHLPAILKGTPGFEDLSAFTTTYTGAEKMASKLRVTKKLDPAKVFNAPTLKERTARTWDQVEGKIDDIIVEPKSLTVGGYLRDSVLMQIHRTFRNLITAHVKGDAKVGQYLMDATSYDALPAYAKEHWLSIEELGKVAPGLGDRMSRMVRVALDKDGIKFTDRLPVISRDVAEAFFGKEGSAMQSATSFGKIFELYTAVHKTASTALNIPTHVANLLGNMMFMAMAGVNPFSPEVLNDGQLFSKAFAKLAKKSGDRPTEEAFANLLTKETLAEVFGADRHIVDNLGNKIDLAEVFSDPAMADLFEAQSFESTEGLMHLHRALKQVESASRQNFTTKSVSLVARTLAGFGETPGIRQTLNTLSAAYLGEDMVPKMQYAANLLRRGWGVDAIVKEVGRRFPQYRTVGKFQNSTRRLIFPWVTFPTEVARIMKNNMMDYPASMIAWLHGPAIAQSLAFGAGLAPNFEETHQMINGTPGWAARASSVFLGEKAAGPTLGAVGGATVGGLAGAAVGGAVGAAIGGTAGAVGGAILGKQSPVHQRLTQDDLNEHARAWALDFLPQSSLMFSSTHPMEWEKIDPMGAPASGKEVLGTLKDLSPIEPYAIAMPLMEIAQGRGSFGQEIETKSLWDFATKASLGLFGMLMPPAIAKYGMRVPGPGGMYPLDDVMNKNGNQLTIPRGLTATVFGLAMGGLTALGAAKLPGASTAKTVGAGLLSGVPAAMAGTQINTRRLMTDLGFMRDPYTNEYGDWVMDFFYNTFMGVNKSWQAGNPRIEAANVERRNKRFDDLRNISTKTMMDSLRNGSESGAIAAASEAYKLFQYQWGQTDQADTKFFEWLDRNVKNMSRLPQFAGVSNEELLSRLVTLRDTLKDGKSKYLRQMLSEMEVEQLSRSMMNAKGLRLVAQ